MVPERCHPRRTEFLRYDATAEGVRTYSRPPEAGHHAYCARIGHKQLPALPCTMSRHSVWATKVAALIKGNNSQAALAQIKVAPTVKDLQQLRALMTADGSLLKHRQIDEATRDQIVALAAPRLHRSP